MLFYSCYIYLFCFYICFYCLFFFFFKQKTAYEMRISDWSSDVCSSDLFRRDAEPEQWPLARSVAERSKRAGRIPADPAVPFRCHRHRHRPDRDRQPARPQPAVGGEALPVRMRLRRVRGLADAVRHPLLPHRHPVHRLRPGNHLHHPVGHSVPPVGRARPDRDGHLRGHAAARLYLRLEEGSPGMGVIQSIQKAADFVSNPLPEGRVDDILRPEGDNPLTERGFVTTSSDVLLNWARTGSMQTK